MAIGYFKSILNIGLQLMTMILLVGIGRSFVDSYYTSMSAGMTLKELAVMAVVAAILLALVAKKLPPGRRARGRIDRKPWLQLRGGHCGRRRRYGRCGRVATAGAALAAGAAGGAGGLSALKAAFAQRERFRAARQWLKRIDERCGWRGR